MKELNNYNILSVIDNIDHLTIKYDSWNEKSLEEGRHYVHMTNARFPEVAAAPDTGSTDMEEINALEGKALYDTLVAIRTILIKDF